jgi:hypothetical protein
VWITDIGGEEFDVAPTRGVTEVRDQCRHNQGRSRNGVVRPEGHAGRLPQAYKLNTRSLNQRTTAQRFSATSFIMRDEFLQQQEHSAPGVKQQLAAIRMPSHEGCQ